MIKVNCLGQTLCLSCHKEKTHIDMIIIRKGGDAL